MANNLLAVLAGQAWWSSIALLLVLVLRRPMRRLFGAELAYRAWLIVPALMLAAAAPEPVRRQVASVSFAQLPQVPRPTLAPAGADWSMLLLCAWLAGALALAAWFWLAHRRFVHGLGRLEANGDAWYSDSTSGGPALLGLWRPRIVLPADFQSRYTAQEQDLIKRHEQVHAARHDALANVLQAGLQCAFWFNPLVHMAALWFRADQELACDAAVLRIQPAQRRVYAQALLKAQMASSAAPVTVACHWQFTHPVKERIMILQQAVPGKTRRVAGRILLASALVCAIGATLSARAGEASNQMYDVAMSLQAAGETVSPHVHVKDGGRFAVSTDKDGATFKAEFVVKKAGMANTVWVQGQIDVRGKTISRPALMAQLGQQARVRVDTEAGTVDLAMTVTALPD
jgi:beta-lactamase regulating signal transducer with metallopeptidase domain